MSAFTYRDGVLCAENVPLARIAERVGTPVYVYAQTAIEQAYRDFVDALAGVDMTCCYALKANSNQAILRVLAAQGAGADVVSGGELLRALDAGIAADRIVFAGVGKTPGEMADALDAGILQFNAESIPELETLSQVAQAKGVTAPVGIRINPDVDARTHAKISTGMKENKFGIDLARAEAAFAHAAALPNLIVEAISVHIGSQLTNVEPYREAFGRVAELAERLIGSGIALKRLDLGGGLGVGYEPGQAPLDLKLYAETAKAAVGHLGLPLIFEPGRRLVADSGVLLTRTLYVKEGVARRFAILDAAMNDLIRPTLYDAHHPFWAVRARSGDERPYDVVGPVCETGDLFAEQRMMPALAPGDLVAIGAAGAYASVMASTYNSRPLVPEVLVRGDDFDVIRARQSYEELIGQDKIPTWLEESTGNQPRSATGTEGD